MVNVVITFVLVLFASGGLLVAVAVPLLARSILMPRRMTDGRAIARLHRLSPGDLGLRFEEQRFEVRDESTGGNIRLAAWWIPAAIPSSQTVLLLHGYGDAKVGSIEWAPFLHSWGWNVVAIDLRAHGESGGAYTTAGYFERHDLDQVIVQLANLRPRETHKLVLMGIDLGAAVAIATAARNPDVAAVVLVNPLSDYRELIAHHAAAVGSPGRMLETLTLRCAQWLSKSDFSQVRPADLLNNLACPVITLQSSGDIEVHRSALAEFLESVSP